MNAQQVSLSDGVHSQAGDLQLHPCTAAAGQYGDPRAPEARSPERRRHHALACAQRMASGQQAIAMADIRRSACVGPLRER